MICKNCNAKFPSTKRINGIRRNLTNRSMCLECQPFKTSVYCRGNRVSARNRVWGKRSPEAIERRKLKSKEKGSNFWKGMRKTRKNLLVSLCGSECAVCGYSKLNANLVFHHIDPKQKLFGICERSTLMSLENVLKELSKCILLCHNCHGEVHFGILNKEQTDRLEKTHAHILSIIESYRDKTWNDILCESS